MVKTNLIDKILKRLEKYIIRKNDFHLVGDNFDLVLFVPSDKYLSDTKYSLLISAKKLDNFKQKEVIKDLLTDFKEALNPDEYNAISRLNILHSEDPLVKNLKFVFAYRQPIIEINDIPVGGVNIDYAFLARSLTLDKLIENHALILEIKNSDNQIETINAGIIRIDNNYDVVYYTGQGLREILKPKNDEQKAKSAMLKTQNESYLVQNNYISKIKLDNIVNVAEV